MNKKHMGGNKSSIGANHVNSSHVSVSFGLPKLTETSKAVRVGLIQDLNIAQQKRIVKLFEYGNDEYVLMSGKTSNQIQIRRVLFDGPSLLKFVGYAFANEKAYITDQAGRLLDPKIGFYDHDNKEQYGAMFDKLGIDQKNINAPGSGDFWMNLTSPFYNNQFGMFLNLKQRTPSGHLMDYGGVFLENCLISSHNLSMSSQTRIISESLMVEFGRALPLKKINGDNIMLIENKLKEIYGGGR